MTRSSRHDTRTLAEIVEAIKTERTERGDTIFMYYQYQENKKPRVWLETISIVPHLKKWNKKEEITDFLDDSYSWQKIDDSTGKPFPDEFARGASSWRDYIDSQVGPLIKSIVVSGGRFFDYFEDVNV